MSNIADKVRTGKCSKANNNSYVKVHVPSGKDTKIQLSFILKNKSVYCISD
jgi:hypothetical protein